MNERDELTLARISREVSEEAGVLIREAFRTAFHVESKSSPIDLVTEVDRAAELLIRERLLTAVPGSAVLGEEFGAQTGDEDGIRWHIDPIDGTNNFVIGQPYFAVSIGAERGGLLVAGAVHDPIHRETYWATSTQAWSDDEALPTAAEYPGHPGLLTSQPFQGVTPRDEDLPGYLELLKSFGVVRNPGSFALQILHVAIGRSGAAFELAGAAPWDIAGALAIAQATGCTIVPLADRTPGYGQWGAHSYLVTRDPALADRVAPRLREILERGTVSRRFTEFLTQP